MKRLKFLLTSVLTVGLLLATSSCSDDDDETYVSIDQTIEQSGILVPMECGIYTIDVKSNGSWTATLPEECDWADIQSGTGNGNGHIVVVVDGNYSGIERTTTITISGDSDTKTFNFTQDESIDGAPNNSSGYQLAQSKNLGFGCNAMEYFDGTSNLTFTTCSAVNLAAVNAMQENDPINYNNLATYSTLRITNFSDVRVDTLEDKKDSLGISLSLSVAYGLFKFKLGGKYVGAETFTDSMKVISIGANYPTMNATIDYTSLIGEYNDWLEEKENGGVESDDYRGNFLSKGLLTARKNLKKACNSGNQTKINTQVANIITNYGSGVAVRNQLGGVIALNLAYDEKKMVEVMHIDTANASVKIQTGLFSLDANVEATYVKEATTFMENSCHEMTIMGGDNEKMHNVSELFNNCLYGDTLTSAISDWAKTLTNGDDTTDGNVELITADIVPIWEFFVGDTEEDDTAVEAIKNYFKSKYPSSKFVKKYITE